MPRKPSSPEYRESLRKRILETAFVMFSTKGIKAVKMDDIAKSLTISKRTLYEFYTNKEDVIFESVKMHHEQTIELKRERLSGSMDAMDILIQFLRDAVEGIKTINPSFFEEIRAYPRVKQYLDEYKAMHSSHTMEFLRRGQEEGFFLDNINLVLLQSVNACLSDYLAVSRLYMQYPVEEMFRTLVLTSVRGICTQKGICRIDEKFF